MPHDPKYLNGLASLDDNAADTNDPLASQGSLDHLRRGPEPLHAARRMLSRYEAEPSSKIARPAERIGSRSQDDNRCGDQKADTRHRHRPPGHLVLLGAAADLDIELFDLRLELGERPDQNLQRSTGITGQTAFRVLEDCDLTRVIKRQQPLSAPQFRFSRISTKINRHQAANSSLLNAFQSDRYTLSHTDTHG